jgi:hypothetical protein
MLAIAAANIAENATILSQSKRRSASCVLRFTVVSSYFSGEFL